MQRTWRILITAAVLVAVTAVWAIAFNAVRPEGIPLLRPRATDNGEGGDGQILTLARAKGLYDEGAVFIDSRSPEEFAAGHIRGARLLYYVHVAQDWEEVMTDVDFGAMIVVYCSGAGCNSSYLVANQLEDVGFENVFIFDGGWPQWAEAKYPLVGQPVVEPKLYEIE
ncbi:MAG TPA: rhodanese-like domain-containing protein [bacterium]|nr:rhodanese-like domain-containing protein [bacterium]